MDIWPQRERFKEKIKAYHEATGQSHEQMADAMGVARSSLRFWLYQRKRRPSFEVLKRAAAVLGCSVTEFVDDPGSVQAPGVDQDAWSGASERDRHIIQTVFADLTAADFTDEDKGMLFAAWKSEVAKLRRYRETKRKTH